MDKVSYEPKGDVFWSYVFSAIYTSLAVLGFYLVMHNHINIFRITPIELFILTLAVYRLIRLFVYDKIMQFVRDWFTDVHKEWDKKRQMYKVTRSKPHSGPKRKVYELLACPWCTGMWVSLIVLFTYYLVPWSFPIFAFFAIAGVATFFQIGMNLIGWHAEAKKIEVQSKQK